MFKNKGQSTLEYVIVLTAIIAVVLVFAGGLLRANVRTSLQHVGSEMQQSVQRIRIR